MLKAIPVELRTANEFVALMHRHHDPVHRDKFRVAAINENGEIVGVVQVGRPVARGNDDGLTVEVVRLCTDGTKNACSFLYARAAKAADALGYRKIITYILDSEDGTSLKAAGWHFETETRGGSWNCQSRPRQTTAPTCKKQRWAKDLGGGKRC